MRWYWWVVIGSAVYLFVLAPLLGRWIEKVARHYPPKPE